VFRSMLFSRIVPCVKDIGLWGDKVQKCYAEMGVLDMAGLNLDELMKADEDYADQLDREKKEFGVRAQEVEETIALGAS
jgi:hydrogenase maturation factor HypE